MSRIVTIAGSPSEISSSDALLSHVTRRIARAGHEVTPLVLRDLPPAALLSADVTDPAIAAAVQTIADADALVIVSPVDQAAYSALLKVFLDLLPQFAFRGKSVLPMVTGGSVAHVLAVDHPLRPVLNSLGAAHIGQGWFVLTSHLRVFPDGGVLIDPASAIPVAQVTDDFLAALTRHVSPADVPDVRRRVSPVAGDPDLTVAQVQVGDPELQPLLDELVIEYGTRYGRISAQTELTEVPVTDFEAPFGTFLVLIENGETIAGGAIRRYDDETAEVKRVWTSSRHRRRGLARRLMAELELAAMQLGYRRMHLTTGPRQPEARSLYLAGGYHPRFDLNADPETIGPLAFAKELVPGAGFPPWEQPTWEQVQPRHQDRVGVPVMTHPPVVVFVGGGPRTVSLLERLAANAPELLPAAGLDIHVVDPYPAGGGRIWRRSQSPLLWMNSMAKDVTIFPDESVTCEGPIVPGPPLDEWVAGPGRGVLIEAGLAEAADAFTADDFASREIASLYLSWTFDRVVASLPENVVVTTHQQRAVAVADGPGTTPRQRVELADGTLLTADVVVLAQGYLDRRASPAETALTAAAAENGLTYLPPDYTADTDLDVLRPGQTVLVRGFGLAFIDLMVLVFQGRGGTFVDGVDGDLEYLPGGAEPLLYVGSRRGVPYHAKLGYRLESTAPVAPTYFTPAAVAALATGRPADFASEIWPLVVKELTAAHYGRLFSAHGERTEGAWTEFERELARLDVSGPEFAALVERAVPDPADRFDISLIDRPLRGRAFANHDELSSALVAYVSDDLARRADPLHSADHAVFNALLGVHFVLAGAVVAGQISARDRVRYTEGQFHGLFSFIASGPPPRRLAELLALHRAGFVRFAGPDLAVTVCEFHFVASSPAVPGEIIADALVDARLPKPDVRAASDPVISSLLSDGELAAEDLADSDGSGLGGGQLLADAGCHAIRADRTVHPRRFLLGPSVSGSAGSAGFARPGFNGAGFRQNDAVARELLQLASALPSTHVGGPSTEQQPTRSNRPTPVRPVTPVHSAHHPNPHPSRIEISHAR